MTEAIHPVKDKAFVHIGWFNYKHSWVNKYILEVLGPFSSTFLWEYVAYLNELRRYSSCEEC